MAHETTVAVAAGATLTVAGEGSHAGTGTAETKFKPPNHDPDWKQPLLDGTALHSAGNEAQVIEKAMPESALAVLEGWLRHLPSRSPLPPPPPPLA